MTKYQPQTAAPKFLAAFLAARSSPNTIRKPDPVAYAAALEVIG